MTDPLDLPVDLDFDNAGNMYVCESGSHRVQFFALISNKSCSTSKASMRAIPTIFTLSFYYAQYLIAIVLTMLTWFNMELF
ncbi:unnamed protein product [Rotaria sordida]|uniref:Uncharacterized protein n=1 Tax=Rotaria sordida TaxID=392033 RepID=A0A815NDU8_9BILA|nr:unnamed protein product [Rotaria sordida]CAF1368700.1 unnamed protein product [Rotaria sordida]CAF1433375.1 unnamed protein product [Rotaria sordida]CAF1596713.1 unnamed protein product [Rotaria sordida]